MSSGTNKQRLEQNNTKIDQIIETLNHKIIGQGNYETAKGLADGSLTEFVASDYNITSLWSYRFYQFPYIEKLDLRGITSFPAYVVQGSTTLKTLIFDTHTTRFDGSGFSNLKNSELEIDLNFTDGVYMGISAFDNSRVKSIQGYYTTILQYAFRNENMTNDILATVNIKVNGAIGSDAFNNRNAVSSFTLDPTSVITTLSGNAFKDFGKNRANPSSNVFTFDFRNSTFASVGNSCFVSSVTNNKMKYFNIYLPSTVTSLGTSAFAYSDNFNIYYNSIPTLSNTNTFSGTTNLKNFFPYDLLQTAKNSTNWSDLSIVSTLYGYAPENTFSVGDTLPEYDSEGYALTWYSDIAMTTQVTTVSDATQIYYCTVGNRAKVRLNITTYEATCTVSDGTNTYVSGDLIPIGDSITLTTQGSSSSYEDLYMFLINGTDIGQGSTTITVPSEDLVVAVAYYGGIRNPFEATFADNSWSQIKRAVDSGFHRILWTIGDTKSVTLTDSSTFTIRYIDQTANRYEKTSGGTYSNAVFEFTDCPFIAGYNNAFSNVGGYSAMNLYSNGMPTFYAKIPTDLQNVISEVKIPSFYSYNDTTVVYSNCSIFPPAMREMYTGSPQEGTTTFNYYNDSDNTKKVKQFSGAAKMYFTRTPYVWANNGYVYVIGTTGTTTYGSVTGQQGIAVCFAI